MCSTRGLSALIRFLRQHMHSGNLCEDADRRLPPAFVLVTVTIGMVVVLLIQWSLVVAFLSGFIFLILSHTVIGLAHREKVLNIVSYLL